MRIPRFEYHAPETIDEAAGLLKRLGEQSSLAAGGTDLFVRMKQRLITPEHVVSLAKIPGIDEISFDAEHGLTIGARASLTQISRSPLLGDNYHAVSQAAHLIATEQIRNMATVGGNICQQTRCKFYNRAYVWQKTVAPCFKRGGNVCHAVKNSKRCFAVYQGDLAPAIIALNGRVGLISIEGAKTIPLEDMFRGGGKSLFSISRDAVLKNITIPAPVNTCFSVYKKYRIRDGMDYPLAGVAVGLHKEGNRIETMRICITGVWSSPVLLQEAAQSAIGNRLTGALIKGLAAAAFDAVHPLDNLEDTLIHRRKMVRLMVEEALMELSRR